MAQMLTDEELRLVAEYIVRRYLEVERGLRSKESLRRYLTGEAYGRQYSQEASRFGSGGVVRQGDIGQLIFQRDGDRVFAAAPTREEGDRWGALLLEMHSNGRGAWRVTELTRAQDRNLVHPHPRPDFEPLPAPELDIQRTAETVAASQTARTAAEQRHAKALAALARLAPERDAADLRPGLVISATGSAGASWVRIRRINAEAEADLRIVGTDGTVLRVPHDRPVAVLSVGEDGLASAKRGVLGALQDVVAAAASLQHWSRRTQELERERDRLIERRDAYALLAAREASAQPPAHLLRLLGPPPARLEAKQAWQRAAAQVEAYRDRWHVTDSAMALGSVPEHAEQRADRAAVVRSVRSLMSRIQARDEPSKDQESPPQPGREAESGDTAQDPFDRELRAARP